MTETVRIPGPRTITGSLDGDSDGCVVACPPHPQQRGTRHDTRLQAVSDALTDRGVACLRIDYGPWDEGRGERGDIAAAIEWARDRFVLVGVFGFSFGATLGLVVAADGGVSAVSALAPTARAIAGESAVDAFDRLSVPAQVVYGSRDDTADWGPVVERARGYGACVVELPADHFFVGQERKVAAAVADFFETIV